MKKTTFMFGTFLVVTAMLVAIVSDIALSGDRSGRRHEPVRLLKTNGSPVSTMININNVAGWIRNDGWSARDPQTGNSGVYFPRGTSTAIYQDGIVWGGNVNDGGAQVLRVGGQTYSIGTVGGRIITQGVAASPDDPDVRVYRVRRDYQVADLRQDAAELGSKAVNSVSQGEIDAVRAQYETDWNEWPASQGAPYYDRDSNGTYDPAVDEPGIADADQVVWFVCNDLNAGKTNALYGSNPIGFELQVTLWGYNRTDPLANVYFKKFTFIYKGTATTPANSTITDMYVGQWSDPDEGDSGDDFAGCDTSLSVAYVYNAGPVDNQYAAFGLKPPAVGYDFLQGPLVAGLAGQDLNKNGIDDSIDTGIFNLKRTGPGLINLPMTAAFYFAAGSPITDPPFTREGTIQWYNLLRGLIPISGSPFVHPNFPQLGSTTYWLDGDPVANSGRIDGAISGPGDRRIGACSGPFTMTLGDTQEVVVGVVAGIGGDYKNSITVMKNNDVAVQNAYNDLFDLPKAPPAPIVNIVQLDKRIILDWGSDAAGVQATEEFNKKEYTFQGYNVYQVISQGTSIDLAGDKRSLQGRTDVKHLGTFDIAGDAVRTISDLVFDSKLGIVVPVVKQLGTDNGIVRTMEITTDLIRNAQLVNGQRYYFAVTAYGYNPSDQALTHALESTPRIITAIPQTPIPGIRYSSSYGDTISYVKTGASDGSIVVTVIDPTKVTGHEYDITFAPDTVNEGYWWTVTDVTLNQVVLLNQKNQTGDEAYVNVDGLKIKVLGPIEGMKSWSVAPADNRRFSPVGGFAGLGLEGFSDASNPSAYDRSAGTIGIAKHLEFGGIGTTLSGSQFHTVKIQLAAVNTTTLWDPLTTPTDTNFSRGYRVLRNVAVGGTPAEPQFAPWIINRGSGYPYQDYNYGVPFSAWDMETSPPTRLSVGMFENNVAGGLVDGRYWPRNASQTPDNTVAREFCFIYATPYSNTPDTLLAANLFGNATTPMMWVMVCNRRNENNWAAGDEMTFDVNHINSETTVYTFTAPAASAFDAATAKADVTKINVFPNPYYGFNRAETSKSTRFVTFNHMPFNAEVRIFNLTGALVRALVKNDQTQFFTWDLNNTGGLPVASGIYIVYMTLKDESGADLGTKTLKLVIIQEQQYMDNF
jgi:hypothetical protein